MKVQVIKQFLKHTSKIQVGGKCEKEDQRMVGKDPTARKWNSKRKEEYKME